MALLRLALHTLQALALVYLLAERPSQYTGYPVVRLLCDALVQQFNVIVQLAHLACHALHLVLGAVAIVLPFRLPSLEDRQEGVSIA
jgi:hypothetical protein